MTILTALIMYSEASKAELVDVGGNLEQQSPSDQQMHQPPESQHMPPKPDAQSTPYDLMEGNQTATNNSPPVSGQAHPGGQQPPSKKAPYDLMLPSESVIPSTPEPNSNGTIQNTQDQSKGNQQ
jgi:hypothetical protein